MPDSHLEIVEEVVVAGGLSKRHRSRAGLKRLPDGELFAAYRVGWDMFEQPHGAVVGTWSRDGGLTWEEPLPLLAEPGWDWFGAQRLLQSSAGELVMLAGRSRWSGDDFSTVSVRSEDGGRTWHDVGPEIQLFPLDSEPYGRGANEIAPGGRMLMGFHGRHGNDESTSAAVARSADRGRTWTDRGIIARQPGLDFREPDLLCLDDGRLLSVMRTDSPRTCPTSPTPTTTAAPGRRRFPPDSTATGPGCFDSAAVSPAFIGT